MTESGVLHKPVALVTAPRLVGNAERLLRAGGVDLTYMQYPIDEDALVAEFERAPIAAIVMRGAPPLTRRVLSTARELKSSPRPAPDSTAWTWKLQSSSASR